MTVRVNKPSFNIREKLSELGRKFGLKGSELAAAETVQEARDLVSAGRKNLVMNGDFRIAQRGTSGTKNGNGYRGYLSVDRWAVYYDDTVIAQTDVTINGQLKKACKVTAAGTNGRAYVYHKIENSSRILGDGTPFSISFWARGSRSEQRQVHWRYYDHGNQNNGSNTDITTITIGTEWKHYKIENISIVDANYNATRDGGLWLFNSLADDTGTGFWFEFTEVQIEIGRNATEFEHRSYGEELALCQRYFFKLANSRLIMGYKRHDGSANFPVNSPVPMRAQPTPSLTASGTFSNFQSSFSTTQSSPNVYEWSESGSRFIFQVQSTWSSTHTYVPAWESFTAEFNSEL